MFFKFLLKSNLEEQIKTYKGNFIAIYKPGPHSSETHCYVEIESEDYDAFAAHFHPGDAQLIPDGSVELPNSILNRDSDARRRMDKFTVIGGNNKP